MKKAKYLIMGVIIGVIISSLCIYADDIMISIEKLPLKYMINGVEAIPAEGEEGFIYNDRTYVPIRFVAETLGNEVGWNGEDYTVSVSEKIDKYNIEDKKLYAQKEILLESLLNYDEMVEDAGYNDEEILEVTPVGVYNEYAVLMIAYGNPDNEEDYPYNYIYVYNLKDNSYKFIQNYVILSGGLVHLEIVGDNLVIPFENTIYVYKIDTQVLVFEKELKGYSNFLVHGDYAYFSLYEDFENGDYKLYKQKFGESEELCRILEEPFVIEPDDREPLRDDYMTIRSYGPEILDHYKFDSSYYSQEPDYDKILKGNLREFTGVYKNGHGDTFRLNSDGTWGYTTNSGEPVKEKSYGFMKLDDGSYMWNNTGENGVGGYAVNLYPVGVPVIGMDGQEISTDTTQVRLAGGHILPLSADDVYYLVK